MIKEEDKKSMVYALNSALIAFQNINASMSMQNIKYSNIVISNIQAVLQLMQNDKKEDNEQFKKQADEAVKQTNKAVETANNAAY